MARGALFAVGVILAALAGIGLAFQTGVNTTLGRAAGNKPFAAVISFSVGTAASLIYFLLDTYPRGRHAPSLSKLKEVPGWGWIGGVLGAFYVVVTVIFAPTLGAGTLTAVFVTAQLIMSVLLDYWGLVGFQKKTLPWVRILGAVLMIIGVILISVFDGTPRGVKHQQPMQAAHNGSSSIAGEAARPTQPQMGHTTIASQSAPSQNGNSTIAGGPALPQKVHSVIEMPSANGPIVAASPEHQR